MAAIGISFSRSGRCATFDGPEDKRNYLPKMRWPAVETGHRCCVGASLFQRRGVKRAIPFRQSVSRNVIRRMKSLVPLDCSFSSRANSLSRSSREPRRRCTMSVDGFVDEMDNCKGRYSRPTLNSCQPILIQRVHPCEVFVSQVGVSMFEYPLEIDPYRRRQGKHRVSPNRFSASR